MADWTSRYLSALENRDKHESAHKTYIDAYTRLADRKSTPTSALPPNINPNTNAGQGDNDTIIRLRADLTSTQKSRTALTSELTTLRSTHTTLLTSHTTLQSSLTCLQRQNQLLERKISDRDQELKAKQKLVENVQDEMLAQNMELNVMGQEMERLRLDNADLVRRCVEWKEGEAEKANREGGWN